MRYSMPEMRRSMTVSRHAAVSVALALSRLHVSGENACLYYAYARTRCNRTVT